MIHPEEGALLLELGIRAMVSLTIRDPACSGNLPAELRRMHAPVPDFGAPEDETVDRVMDFMAGNVDAGRPVLVHCGAGYGRTGTILACFLVHRGASAGEAIRLVRERRPGSIETPAQEAVVRRHAERRVAAGRARS